MVDDMRLLRPLCGGILVAALTLIGGTHFGEIPQASATVALAHPLSELVDLADRAVVATPGEHISRWEDHGGRRIVTYTKLTVESRVFGSCPETVWVRTLGGEVDGVGQLVAGQAKLETGKRAVLFLQPAGEVLAVSGAAQGHYPLRQVERDKTVRTELAASPARGKIVRRPGPSLSAQDLLVGTTLPAAQKLIQQARKERDDARRGK